MKARHDLPSFDPEDLPVTEAEDWSWFMPGKLEAFRSAQR